MEDSLKIRDTRKDRCNKADGANARIIDLLHGLQPSLDADGIVHIILKPSSNVLIDQETVTFPNFSEGRCHGLPSPTWYR